VKTRKSVLLFLLFEVTILVAFANRAAGASEPYISPDPSELQPPADYMPYTPTTHPSFWDQYGPVMILAAILISISISVAIIQYSKNKSR